MSPKTPSVSDLLAALAHPQGELIDRIRKLVLSSGPELVEGVKWNAPSYSLEGNDIITFNFRSFEGVALIFHTGPKGKDTHTGTRMFEGGSRAITWLADKRFAITLADSGTLDAHAAEIAQLVNQWVGFAKKGFLA